MENVGTALDTDSDTRRLHASWMSHFESFVWKGGQMRLVEAQSSQQEEDVWRRLRRRILHGILRALCAWQCQSCLRKALTVVVLQEVGKR